MGEGEAARWVAHSRMSDPGPYRGVVPTSSAGIAGLVGVVQGLLIHAEEREAYGVASPGLAEPRRATLPVADRLGEILADDPRPLEQPRDPAGRAVGTCRDFALLLCSFLRQNGVPGRVRCGFAAYFGGGWHDHWVCEHWDAPHAAWRISDPQMDPVLRAKYRVDFDPAAVPRCRLQTAGEAWSRWRAGRIDPSCYGHGATTGPWFLKVNVARDHLAVGGRETSAWDGWRSAPAELRRVLPREIDGLDRLAANPGRDAADVVPDWRAGAWETR